RQELVAEKLSAADRRQQLPAVRVAERVSLIHAFAEHARNLTLREEDETRGCYQALRRVPVQIGDVVQQLPMPVARIQREQGTRELGSPFDARPFAAPDGHRCERKTE